MLFVRTAKNVRRDFFRADRPKSFEIIKILAEQNTNIYLERMISASALLARKHHDSRPTLQVSGPLAFTLSRAHELCGPARRTLALAVAARRPGPVLWITPQWETERLNGPGLYRWMDPNRMIFAHPRRGEDVLWCLEEALRAGIVPTVIAEAPVPPALTPVRRLHLAAEEGGTKSSTVQQAPLGLILSGAEGVAAGVESRWSLRPAFDQAGPAWHLARLRARAAPPAEWHVSEKLRDNRSSLHIHTPKKA